MKNYKIIIIPMILITILIIIIVANLLLINKKKVREDENPVNIPSLSVVKLQNKNLFFTIDYHIGKFVDNKKIDINNFESKEIYVIDKSTNITAFVFGITKIGMVHSNVYLIVNIDNENDTYAILASSKQEFYNAKNDIVDEKYKQDIYIEKNDYNEFINGKLSDFEVLKKYFDDYKYNAINNPEMAFNMIDASYRKAKFNNDLEQYKSYVQKNINSLQDANILKHGVIKENGYLKYNFVDNYDNYYQLTETGIYEYTIILDNYTLQTAEQKAQYNKLTDEEKALSNMDKIMKLIDEKDYSTVYNYLNTDFKNTNFPTIEVFTKYIQENFFENNKVGIISTRSEGNVFMLSVPYKESLSSAAETRTKTFIMKLGEGTDFEISFEI